MSRMFVWLVADSKFLFDTMLTFLKNLSSSELILVLGQTLHNWLTIVNIIHNKPRKWSTISLLPSSSLSSSSRHSLLANPVARVPQVLGTSSTHPGEGCQGRQVASINTGPQRNEDRVDVRPEETSWASGTLYLWAEIHWYSRLGTNRSIYPSDASDSQPPLPFHDSHNRDGLGLLVQNSASWPNSFAREASGQCLIESRGVCLTSDWPGSWQTQ